MKEKQWAALKVGDRIIRRYDKTAWEVVGVRQEPRAALPVGLVCVDRAETDDPCIVETWL